VRGALAVVFLFLSSTAWLASAQTPAGTQSKPPQQQAQAQPTPQQMMGYFAGDWSLTGTAKISPNSPSAPFSSTEHGEWLPGGYFLEIRSVSHGPLGDVHGVRMMEYNTEKSLFTYNAYNSLGEHQIAICKVQGDIWVWNADEKMNGIAVKGRHTLTLTSPNSYNYKSEVQKPDGGWVTVAEGKATRTPAQ
jgi:hypothetical protein